MASVTSYVVNIWFILVTFLAFLITIHVIRQRVDLRNSSFLLIFQSLNSSNEEDLERTIGLELKILAIEAVILL